MSLRNDIRTAFDAITPEIGGMTERVVETARREARVRQRRRRFMFRMRAPMTLVAVFVVVAIVVALFIGAQAVRIWNAQQTTAPAGAVSGLAQLEARPLNLPTLSASAACPDKLGANSLGLLGDGPVYTQEGDLYAVTTWGNYWMIEYFVAPSVQGPVLIRGKDIRSSNRVVFMGKGSAGPSLGTDSQRGHTWQQRSEAVIAAGTNPEVFTGQLPGWKVVQGLYGGWTGCFGLQIDGEGFSETIIWGA